MDTDALLTELLGLAERLGVEIRHVYLAGTGGGLCVVRGKPVLFVDSAAPLAERLARTATDLAGLDGLEECYLLPEVRQVLEHYRDQR